MATLGLINYRGGQTAVSHLISGVDQESRRSSRMFRGKKGNLAFYYGQGEVQVVVWPLLNAMGEESERKTSLAKHWWYDGQKNEEEECNCARQQQIIN